MKTVAKALTHPLPVTSTAGLVYKFSSLVVCVNREAWDGVKFLQRIICQDVTHAVIFLTQTLPARFSESSQVLCFYTRAYNLNCKTLGITNNLGIHTQHLWVYLPFACRTVFNRRQCQRSNRINSRLRWSIGVLITYFNLLVSPWCSFSAYEAR